jgi:uncharacterized membrane protein
MLGLDWQPFSSTEEQKILDAIVSAEENTSGEIRVHVDRYCKSDPVFKAKNQFLHLEMSNTELRNGVLIYVAMDEHKFAIVGDEGIDAKVGPTFWHSTKDLMIKNFKANKPVDAICEGIAEAGKQLKKYFPITDSDKNELHDTISYG